ncbi:hypothetical protein FACS189428_4240 [Clostridia bacterium]|nr:hypothetical protein FACS189428_4240 [Clostridia bacterium]
MNHLHQYLLSLTKNELIEIVEKFAPEQFGIEVNNKFANNDKAHKIFNESEQEIRELLDAICMIDDPDDFSNALDEQLSKLSGLEKHLKAEIEPLLFDIFSKVEDAIDEGYLYEHYSDNSYEMSSYFETFVADYVANLDGEEKTTFLQKLDAVLEEQSYDIFEDLRDIAQSVFTENDLPALKNVLLNTLGSISHRLAGNYYDCVRPLLSDEEKATVLTVLMEQNCKYLMERAELLAAHDELDKATYTLKTGLMTHRNDFNPYKEDAYSLYLNLLTKKGGSLFIAAQEILFSCPTRRILTEIVRIMPDNAAVYEQLLEKNAPSQLLEYLRQEERLDDALALIKRKSTIYDSDIDDFFKNYKKLFPVDAEQYFSRKIEKNLEGTGEYYYQTISEIIRELIEINSMRANEHLNNIRTNYKRRRNLLSLLADL